MPGVGGEEGRWKGAWIGPTHFRMPNVSLAVAQRYYSVVGV